MACCFSPENITALLAETLQKFTKKRVRAEQMVCIRQGASGRWIMRCNAPGCAGIICMYWSPDRADNASFLPALRGLSLSGVHVPRLYVYRELGDGHELCLVEDLGDQTLLSMRGQDDVSLSASYEKVLQNLDTLHRTKPNWPLQPPFDEALYAWEHEYFAQHYLALHRNRPDLAEFFIAAPECHDTASYLASLPRHPIHRDCQSENILMRDGIAYFVDFQGMRLGLPEYDIASLLYDPYMDLSAELREKLLLSRCEKPGLLPLRYDLVKLCAIQRLLQALGAYANIAHNKQQERYLQYIPTAERLLAELCSSAAPDSPAAPFAACVRSVLSSSS